MDPIKMRNLTPTELFNKGYEAMVKKDYLIAEKHFLMTLYQCSITNEDSFNILGALNQLSLHLYSKGLGKSKEKMLEFFKHFSRIENSSILKNNMGLVGEN